MTDTRQFAEFVQNNESEGESWRFWLQLDGNEEAFEALKTLIEDQDEEYELTGRDIPEADVDVLVRHRISPGYMHYENKLTGVFTCPDDADDLYKSGIEDCFKGTK